jgi:hypothetical protein
MKQSIIAILISLCAIAGYSQKKFVGGDINAVKSITADSTGENIRIVSLNGTTVYNGPSKSLNNVAPGAYIVISGNTATKVVFR